jgi:TonB family protein
MTAMHRSKGAFLRYKQTMMCNGMAWMYFTQTKGRRDFAKLPEKYIFILFNPYFMKQVLTAVFLLATTISISAQTREVRSLHPINEKSVVIYTTATCSIVFLKGEMKNAFSNDKTTNWFLLKSKEEQQAAMRAIALLDKSEGPLFLLADDAMAPADKRELASLIKQRMGAGLLRHGHIEVFDSNKKRLDTIEMAGYSKFFFKNSNTPFFVSEGDNAGTGNVKMSGQQDMAIGTAPIAADPGWQKEEKQDENAVFELVEMPAEYPGGSSKLKAYISNNLRYPEKDKLAGNKGTAFVSFIVEKDGSLTDLRCVKAPGDDMCQEALRLIRESGKWKTAMQNGKTVRVKTIIPVHFTFPSATKQ